MPPVLKTVLLALVAVAAAACIILLLLRVARKRLAESDIYIFPRLKFGTAFVFNVEGDNGEPVRILSMGGMYQSATYLDDRYTELIFEYDKQFDLIFQPHDQDVIDRRRAAKKNKPSAKASKAAKANAAASAADVPVAASAPALTDSPVIPEVRNVLMIGGGGYAYPKHLVATRPDARIDVVEIDPKVTSIAQRYFFLDRLAEEYETDDNGRLGIITDDGRHFLDELARKLENNGVQGNGVQGNGVQGNGVQDSQADGGQDAVVQDTAVRYDAILNDSFVGKTPAACMATVEAARSVHRCLNPGGMFVSNVVSSLEGEKSAFIKAVVATLAQEFEHVYVIPCDTDEFADYDNNTVIATDMAYDFPRAYAMDPAECGPILKDGCEPQKVVKKLAL